MRNQQYECSKCGKYAPFLYHISFTDCFLVCKECAKGYEITKNFEGEPILY